MGSNPDDDFAWTPSGNASSKEEETQKGDPAKRISVLRVPRTDTDGRELFIQFYISPRAGAVLVICLAVLSRLVDALVYFLE